MIEHWWVLGNIQQQIFKLLQASCIVSLDNVRIHRRRQLFTIHICEYQCSTQECLLHHKRSFIVLGLFPSKIFLNRWHLLQNKISLNESTRAHPFVENILHSSLIQLFVTQNSQCISFNKIQLVKMCLDPFYFFQLCF